MGGRNADSALVTTEAMPEGSSSLGVVHFRIEIFREAQGL
jgi:hypothetical protein